MLFATAFKGLFHRFRLDNLMFPSRGQTAVVAGVGLPGDRLQSVLRSG